MQVPRSLRIVGKKEIDQDADDDGGDTLEDEAVAVDVISTGKHVLSSGNSTHSHCQPYSPLNPDMNDTPVAMRPPNAPATAMLAEKMAIRVCANEDERRS